MFLPKRDEMVCQTCIYGKLIENSEGPYVECRRANMFRDHEVDDWCGQGMWHSYSDKNRGFLAFLWGEWDGVVETLK